MSGSAGSSHTNKGKDVVMGHEPTYCAARTSERHGTTASVGSAAPGDHQEYLIWPVPV
jgi:hypothetical protein